MVSSGKAIALQVGNVIAFVLTLVVNGLAGTTLLGGRTTAEVSNTYSTLVTPAGYVFAIWGIIYTLLFLFVAYQAFPSQRSSRIQQKISFLFILSCVFNVAWLFLWQYDYITWSVILMLALLTTLGAIYLRIGSGSAKVTLKEKAFANLPFSVYLGWITIATFANVAAAMSQAGWIMWTAADATLGIALLAILLVIVLGVVTVKKDIAYGLVAVWALVGVAVNQSAVPDIVYTAYLGASISAGLILVIALWALWKTADKKQTPK